MPSHNKQSNKYLLILITTITLSIGILLISKINNTKAQTDTTPPTTPTNLTAAPTSSSQINLTWTASTDDTAVTGYNIYRCTGTSCTPTTLLTTSTTNSYSDTGLTAETTYTYTVSAYDTSSNTSSNSTSASATTEAYAGNVFYMNADGSENCTNLQECFGLMLGGDTLIIRDGTYSGDLNVIDISHRPPNGMETNYTVVKAEHSGKVMLDGEAVRNMVDFRGLDWTNHAKYIEINGILITNTTGDLFHVAFADHLKIKQCGVFETNGTGYMSNGFHIDYSSYVLFEDCYSYGSSNYNFIADKDAEKIIFRRCVTRHDRYPLYFSQAAFAAYDSKEVEFQNCIAIDADQTVYYTAAGGSTVPPMTWMFRGTSGDHLKDINFRGCISFNNESAYGVVGSLITGDTNVLFQNSIIHINSNYGSRTRSDGADFNHCLIGDIHSADTFWGDGIAFEQNSRHITNSLIYNITSTIGITGGDGSSDYNSMYGNHVNYSGIAAGTHDISSENSNAINPITGTPGNGTVALKYLLQIEDGSNLDGVASDGGDIGATIIYQYGKTGTLWGEEGYNLLQDGNNGQEIVSLWPFPNEDIIKEKMQAYSYDNGNLTGNRGFAEDKIDQFGKPLTLTRYIWQYLGNKIPCEIYNECSTSSDTTPPTLSNGTPTGTLPSGTTSTTLSITTNENATCKYSITPNTDYNSMTNTFTTTGTTTHSQTITNLTDGNTYNYYIRCQDTNNNSNTTDTTITFNISPTPITYNLSNFTSLINNWLNIGDSNSDVNNDGIVNTRDLGIMMSHWSE